ncbi:MAG: hypothetical protein GMKNLPBB_02594 [Myxococcota bacterium]|nr:hypothetical protein [Myxococcota bacterium]
MLQNTASLGPVTGWTGGQFSLARAGFAIAALLVFLAGSGGGPWTHEGLGPRIIPDAVAQWTAMGRQSGWSAPLLSLVMIADTTIAILLAAAAAAGMWSRAAPLLLSAWIIKTWLIRGLAAPVEAASGPTAGIPGWMMTMCGFMASLLLAGVFFASPRIPPYGSWDARERPDPQGGFQITPTGGVIHILALLIMIAVSMAAGPTPPWWISAGVIGAAIASQTAGQSYAIAWAGVTMFLLPGALIPAAFLLSGPSRLTPGRPAPSPESPDLLLYDGGCGLCHRTVRFVLAEQRARLFRFAPLGGPTFEERIPLEQRSSLPDSVVVVKPDGELLTRSRAVVHILKALGGPWWWFGLLIGLLPAPVSDWGYDRVASVRRMLFAKPKDACPLLPPDLRKNYFLP